MQFISIESSVKSAFLYRRAFRIIPAVILLFFGFDYFTRAYEGGLLIYYSLSVMSFAGGVLLIMNFFRGPYVIADREGFRFKVTLRDSIHSISWEQLQGIRFENKIVRFQMEEGEWPVHFNCSSNNFGAIKRVLRHYVLKQEIEVEEQQEF